MPNSSPLNYNKSSKIIKITSILLFSYSFVILIFAVLLIKSLIQYGRMEMLFYFYNFILYIIILFYSLAGSYLFLRAGKLLNKKNVGGVDNGIRAVIWISFLEIIIAVNFFQVYTENIIVIFIPLFFLITNILILWFLNLSRKQVSVINEEKKSSLKINIKKENKYINFLLGFIITFLLYWITYFFHGNKILLNYILPIGLLGSILLYWKMRREWLWFIMGLLSGWGTAIFLQTIRN